MAQRCKLARALLWEHSYKWLQLAQLLGQRGVFLTAGQRSPAGGAVLREAHQRGAEQVLDCPGRKPPNRTGLLTPVAPTQKHRRKMTHAGERSGHLNAWGGPGQRKPWPAIAPTRSGPPAPIRTESALSSMRRSTPARARRAQQLDSDIAWGAELVDGARRRWRRGRSPASRAAALPPPMPWAAPRQWRPAALRWRGSTRASARRPAGARRAQQLDSAIVWGAELVHARRPADSRKTTRSSPRLLDEGRALSLGCHRPRPTASLRVKHGGVRPDDSAALG